MDLVTQVATQPHTHRVWKYFQERHQWHDVFPANFAADAEEVGPCTDSDGPCLVLFKNMHLTPEQLDAWLLSCFVGRVCMRVFWLDRSTPAASSWDELVTAVVAAPTVTTPDGVTAVRVDVYPKSKQLDIGGKICAAGYPHAMHPVQYSHVLYAVQLSPSSIRWSYMPADQAWKMPSTAPARFDKSVATAINKLAEAMQVLGLRHATDQQHVLQQPAPASTQQQQQQQQQQQATAAAAAAPEAQQQQQEPQQQQQQPVRWAIDIGACPGGWTSYLADSCCYNVLAVDPAPLHPDVTARPRVRQILGRAQEVGQQVEEALAGQQADLLVCDMNDHPIRVGEHLLPLLPKLKPGGWLILTLKFYGRGREKATMVQHLDKYFQSEMEGGRLTWLLANTLCERTYLAQRRLQA